MCQFFSQMPHSPDNDHRLWQQLDQIYIRHILELKCGGANDTNCKVYQPNVEFLYTYGDKISMTFYTLYLIFFIKADFADKGRKILWIAKDQSTNSSWYIQIRSTWNLKYFWKDFIFGGGCSNKRARQRSSEQETMGTTPSSPQTCSRAENKPLKLVAQSERWPKVQFSLNSGRASSFVPPVSSSPSSPPLSFASSSSSSPHPLQRPFWFCKIIKRGAGRDHWSYHGVKYCNIWERNNNFFVCCCICSKSWAASHCHRHCRTTKERNVCSNGNEQWSINTAWCSSYFLFGTWIIQILLINFN